MANPFYPPVRGEQGHASRGSIGAGPNQQDMPFDPDRRAGSIVRLGRGEQGSRAYGDEDGEGAEDYDGHWERRQPTEGPGGASTFYPKEYVTDPNVGTGTDGFGAGAPPSSAATTSGVPYVSQPDYRATFQPKPNANGDYDGQTKRGQQSSKRTNGMPVYQQPAHLSPSYYEQQQRGSALFYEDDGSRSPASPHDYALRHQYPPPNNEFGYSQSTFDLRAPLAAGADRPDTPGIYRDRAPRMEKLTHEQRKIAESFPKDLDEEGGSLIKTAIKMCKDWRSFVKWKYAHYYILLILICVVVALMTIYHKQIVDWLTPFSKKVRELSWGWVIPVIILFVISFPPLFGHEIVGVLCGVVYGLWMGFGILSLGTLLGELGNFYAFKYFLAKHGEKFERKSIDYACMAHIVREGGFIVVLLARLSAIPGHFTTAVFATVGMNIFVFTIAAVLSLPKQLVVVYLGVAIEQAGDGDESTRSKVIKYIVLSISFIVTIGVAVYLYGKMQKARPVVQAQLRERRFQMLTDAGPAGNEGGSSAAHSKMISEEDVTAGMHINHTDGDVYDMEGNKVSGGAKKGSFWTRWMRKDKGKATREGPGRTMPMTNVARASFDTESMDHNKAAAFGRYDDTLRPSMSYGDQYLAGPHGYASNMPVSSPDRSYMTRELYHDGGPISYQGYRPDQSGPSRQTSTQRQRGAQENGRDAESAPRYQHVAQVGSIYHMPDSSGQVYEAQRQQAHSRDPSAYAMAM